MTRSLALPAAFATALALTPGFLDSATTLRLDSTLTLFLLLAVSF